MQSLESQICDAYNCNQVATHQIKVGVGPLGDIDLNICNNCDTKFNNKGKYGLRNHTTPVNGRKGVINYEYLNTDK